MIFKATKRYSNLPCSHQQHFDTDESGVKGTGVCAKTHGYSREFIFEFSCTLTDENGWVIGFGDLKEIKSWLEYMFDHTTLFEANDPRLKDAIAFNKKNNLFNLRVLPYGVSMEQTALFVAIMVNHYIIDLTNGRVWISNLEVKENDKNSGIIDLSYADAIKMHDYRKFGYQSMLSRQTIYDYIAPHTIAKHLT